jgi:NAD(P)-dependent dehydrogenase (short-subunit alcohol dehydrogenase family)
MNGRIALVTGAGRGIGRETALALSRRGARVMCVARTEAELVQLSDEAPVEILPASIATEESCRRVVDETKRRLGPIEVLVNNAGLGSAGEQPIWDQDPVRWQEAFDVNLNGPFHLTRFSVGDMIARGFGRIVMVSSTAGQVGGSAMAAYCASKAGLLGLMRAVAQDVAAFGVTCNAVLPGWVRTSMADAKAAQEASARGITPDMIWAERASSYAAGRVLEPEEVADVIVFLAGEHASAINGAGILVTLGGTW